MESSLINMLNGLFVEGDLVAYDKREKRRRRRSGIQALVISLIFLYLIIRSVPTLLANNAKTILPEKDILVEKVMAQGFVIKNEILIRATSSGELEVFPDEGERLSGGSKVASVSSTNYNSSLKQELEQIEKSIVALEKSEADTVLLTKDKDKIEDIQKSLSLELQELINKGEYDQVYLLKDKIALYNNKSNEVKGSDTLISQSLEKLKSRKENITLEINSNFVNYYTNTGGILSYNIDGYEEIYIPREFENYVYDKLKTADIKNKDTKEKLNVEANEPIYKIVDNFEWYMGIKIEDIEEMESYEIRDVIRIEMKEDKQELSGRVIAINMSKDNGVVVVKFTNKLHELYNIRFPEIYIIKSKAEGFKISNKTLVEKDSIKGVYIKDTGGIVRFRPIDIIGEEGNYIYVNMGNNKSQIEDPVNGELVKTISNYDEIFLNTKRLKEGQILDWNTEGYEILIKGNLNKVEENIQNALKRAGREDDTVKLITVTKTIDLDRIKEAIDAGAKDIAENRAQELEEKYDIIGDKVNYHMIGHLQTNKIRNIIGKTALIHSLNRLSLAKELNKRSKANDIVTDVLIQVNVSEEASKSGFKVKEVLAFIESIQDLENIKVRGLMTMAPHTDDELVLREVFRTMYNLKEDIAKRNYNNLTMEYLSMGMTNDYEIAIEEGSNMIRIGSAIFGERKY